jgi:hypothetical protein
MKKICILFLLSLAVTVISAQDYKKFKLGLGIGIAAGHGFNALITFEPAYRVSNDLAISLRIETKHLFVVLVDGISISSFTLNGQYYLSAHKLRPFVGGGLGLYLRDDGTGKFGFYPRVGFEVGPFSMSLDCNLIQAWTEPRFLYNNITGIYDIPYEHKLNYSYIGLRIGFFF